MRPGLLAAILVAELVSACASAPPPAPVMAAGFAKRHVPTAPFATEPTSHASFGSTHALTAGTRLRFVSYSLAAGERLRLQRCGEQCATAKLVGSWGKDDFDKSPSQEITIAEPGDYYLWLRLERADGEIGPVQAVAATFDRDAGVLRFASGATVFVAVDGTGVAEYYPEDGVQVMGVVVVDPASPVRKLDSPAILEKARHGVKQSLFVQLDVAASPDAKAKLMASVRALGIEPSGDFGPDMTMLWVSNETQLRALQDSPWVRILNENLRVEPS